ncbi:hypothetical protein [Pseudomonas sp. OTU5201]|uniref:hypothetical protein n=1 Tax=Pseudomonas sp. OTU5201 TaxID=3043850 RepID=UPI00313B6DFE
MNHRSYAQGRQDKHLLAMTISAAFDATVTRFPARKALLVRHQGLRYLRDQGDARVINEMHMSEAQTAYGMAMTGKLQKLRMRKISIEELTPPKDDKVTAIR